MKSLTKLAKFVSLALLTISVILISAIHLGICTPSLGLTTTTDKSAYYIREKVTVLGNVTRDGSPVSDAMVALEMRSYNDITMAYRTVTIGNLTETWVLDITDIAVWDMGSPPNPLDTVKVGETVKISASITNPQSVQRDHVFITISVFDGNMVPLRPYILPDTSILPQSTSTIYGEFYIPKWTYSGIATIYVNVYNDIPANGGVPYAPEKSAQFYISRTEQGWFSYSSTASTSPSQTSGGAYSLTLGLPPTLTPETYSIYSTARVQIIDRATSGTTFDVLYAPYPPTASFVWLPSEPYPNETVTFDASSSCAEGYNDTILQYEWDFGDGTPKVIKTGTPTNPPDPTATHKFMQSRQYIVTLNVTDKEGLWGIAQKPITTKQTNPTAAFTWAPEIGRINQYVTFNASTSQPGWSIRTGSSAPIANYVWNFGDGTGNFTLPAPTTVLNHNYTNAGNFTVLLEVIDSEGQRDSVSHIIEVSSLTWPVWDINGDGTCDIKDITIVAKAFGSTPGRPNWNPMADLYPDLIIDIKDITIVAKAFGKNWY